MLRSLLLVFVSLYRETGSLPPPPHSPAFLLRPVCCPVPLQITPHYMCWLWQPWGMCGKQSPRQRAHWAHDLVSSTHCRGTSWERIEQYLYLPTLLLSTSNFDCHLRDWRCVLLSLSPSLIPSTSCKRLFEWNCCKLFPLRFWGCCGSLAIWLSFTYEQSEHDGFELFSSA